MLWSPQFASSPTSVPKGEHVEWPCPSKMSLYWYQCDRKILEKNRLGTRAGVNLFKMISGSPKCVSLASHPKRIAANMLKIRSW